MRNVLKILIAELVGGAVSAAVVAVVVVGFLVAISLLTREGKIMDRPIGTVKRDGSDEKRISEFIHFWAAWALASAISAVVFAVDLAWYWTTAAGAASLALSWVIFRWGNRNLTTAEVPSLRYRLGYQAIRCVGKLAGVKMDFQPPALPREPPSGFDLWGCAATWLVLIVLLILVIVIGVGLAILEFRAHFGVL